MGQTFVYFVRGSSEAEPAFVYFVRGSSEAEPRTK